MVIIVQNIALQSLLAVTVSISAY